MTKAPPRKQPDNAIDRYRRLHLLTEVLRGQRREATAVPELQRQLQLAGVVVERRTLERDLQFLERALGDRIVRWPGLGWGWCQDLNVPVRIDPQQHSLWLTLAMVEHDLDLALPTDVLVELQPLFEQARKHLAQPLARTYQRWRDRVARSPGLQMLRPPELHAGVFAAIQQALLGQSVLSFDYLRDAELLVGYRVVPLALVLDDGALYLVAHRLDRSSATNPRVYAVHRMADCRATTDPSPELPEFQLNRFLEDVGAFQFPITPGAPPIDLELRVSAEAARLFRERRLADDQQIDAQADGSLRLRARVVNSLRLQWFLLSYGDGVEVLSPPDLRQCMLNLLKRALRPYRTRSRVASVPN